MLILVNQPCDSVLGSILAYVELIVSKLTGTSLFFLVLVGFIVIKKIHQGSQQRPIPLATYF